MAKTFRGRTVSKELFSIGIAGQLTRTDDMPETPGESLVEFKATGRVGAIKHKFLEGGTVEESTILTIDPASFEILGVEEKPEDPQLPLEDGGTVTQLPVKGDAGDVEAPLVDESDIERRDDELDNMPAASDEESAAE